MLEHVKGAAKDNDLRATIDQVATESQNVEDTKLKDAAVEDTRTPSSGSTKPVSEDKKISIPTPSPSAGPSGDKKGTQGGGASTPTTVPVRGGTGSHTGDNPPPAISTPLGTPETHRSDTPTSAPPSPIPSPEDHTTAPTSTPSSSPTPTSGSGGGTSGSSGSGTSGSGSGGSHDATLHSIRTYYHASTNQAAAPLSQDERALNSTGNLGILVGGIAVAVLGVISSLAYLVLAKKRAPRE